MADSKKTPRLVRQFRNEGSDELTPRVKENTVAVVFTVPANGKRVEAPISSFPKGIQTAALAYGLNATIGNAMGNLEDGELDDPDEIFDAIQTRINDLQAGKWTGERTGGGRPSLVWMAFQEFRKSKGQKDDEAKLAALHANWIENEANQKALCANEEFAPFLAKFKASRSKKGSATADLLA